jgi:Clostripain family.
MREFKKTIIIYLSIMLTIISVGCSSKAQGTKTVMIYMIGSDLEDQYGFGSYNIDVLKNAGIDTDTTHVVLKVGGSHSWQDKQINKDGGTYILEGNQLKEIEVKKEDMCNPNTLSHFLEESYKNYKADSYDLILWDHGGGSILGYGYDEVYNSTLKLKDIKTALENSPFSKDNKLEILGFDACLMSCVETGYVLKDYANYMIASQETIPGYGWDYHFLKDVNGITDGKEISEAVIDYYIDFYEKISKKQDVYLDMTLSALDLNKIADVEKNLNQLFSKVDTSLNNDSTFTYLSTSRNDVKEFGKSANYSYDLVDLENLVNEFEKDYKDDVSTLKKSLNDMIIYEKGNVENASGVSIYYPYENMKNVSNYLEEYNEFNFANEYYKYLLNFSSIVVKGNKEESKALENAKILTEKKENAHKLTVELSKEEAKKYAASKYCILTKAKDMKDCYMPVYWDTDLTLNNTTLSANYNNKVMMICSESEKHVVTLWQLDANEKYIRYQVPAIMFNYGEDFSDFKIIRSYFILNVDRQTLDIKLAGVVPADDLENHLAAKSYIDINEYQEIQFMSSIMKVQYDSNGHAKSIRDWTSTGTMEGVSVSTKEKFEFKLMNISEGDFYATIMIKDIYGNYYGSDIQKFSTK